jgi:hypothetical protein
VSTKRFADIELAFSCFYIKFATINTSYMINTLETISWICIALSIFLIIFMFLRRQKIADGFICVWSVCVSLMSAQVFFKQIFGITSWPVSLSLNIAIMVSMYLYSKYIIDTYSQFQKKDFLYNTAAKLDTRILLK